MADDRGEWSNLPVAAVRLELRSSLVAVRGVCQNPGVSSDYVLIAGEAR